MTTFLNYWRGVSVASSGEEQASLLIGLRRAQLERRDRRKQSPDCGARQEEEEGDQGPEDHQYAYEGTGQFQITGFVKNELSNRALISPGITNTKNVIESRLCMYKTRSVRHDFTHSICKT